MTLIIPPIVWVIVYFGLSAWAIYHALLYKRDTRSAMGWITVCLFLPFAGSIAYYLFGINRVKSRAVNIRRGLFNIAYEIGEQKSLPYYIGETNLHDTGLRITGRVASTKNQVIPFFTGQSAYHAMLVSISKAKICIVLSTYILNMDQTGKEFVNALEAAVQRGVDVRVLVDGVGELYSMRKITKILKKRKIKSQRFLPPRLLPPSVYINLRNHRKLLIIDRVTAYAGGMNISDQHTSAVTGDNAISDMHFCFHGPVVKELADLFNRDWAFATGALSPSSIKEINFLKGEGDINCRVIPDGPDAELDTLAITIQAAVSTAEKSVYIVTPYFIPSRELIAILQAASLRGVDVAIILPEKNNLIFMNWANRNTLTELLKWGVKLYYQPAPFAHTKLLLIDSDYALVGSANIDPRSLRLNFELGIEIFSQSFNNTMKTYLLEIIQRSKSVSFDELKNRSKIIRLRDSFFALFSPYL